MGVQCVLQRMHNMTAESASGALHSEREMCYSTHLDFREEEGFVFR